MEVLQGKSLTQQEKEKLKEQLAFLKREYKKTFHRLQRAERAEKVKNYVKKRTAEQNEFLLQKEAGKDPEESRSQTSPKARERVLESTFLEPNAAKATSVVPGLEPEVVIQGDGFPENSGSDCSTPDSKNVVFCPIGFQPEKKQNRFSRSRSKAQRGAALALEERGGSAWDVLWENAGHNSGYETTSIESSGSPVFKRRCSILESDQSIPNASSSAEGGSPGVAVVEPLPEAPGQSVCFGASSPLSDALLYENRGPLLGYLPEEDVFADSEGSAVKKPVSPDDVQRGDRESVQMEEQEVWVGEEEPGRAAGVVGTSDTFQGDGTAPLASRHGTFEERSQCEETRSLDLNSRETSLSKSREMALEIQGEAGSPLAEEALPTMPTKSPLSSCTVVEGLLFPVEYYVRTTRRMSSCQREVNLAAVIQGQLGKRRRRQGLSRKARDASPVLPSREPAGSDDQLRAVTFPTPHACVGPGCEANCPLQSLPVSDAQRRGLIQHRRGRRPRGRPRGRSGSRAAPSMSPEPFVNSDLPAPKDSSCLVPREARGQGAALPAVASGSLEAQLAGGKRPVEPGLAADRCPKAQLENAGSSCATMLGTEYAFSRARGLEVGSEVCCPETKAQQQEGRRSCSGAELVPLDAAPLFQCGPPLAAVWKSEGGRASQGGKEKALRVGSQSHPEPLSVKSETAGQKGLPSQPHLEEFHVPGDERGLLEPDKPEACAVEQLGTFDSGRSGESPWCAGPQEGSVAAGENLRNVSLEDKPPVLSPLQWQLPKKGFPSCELLLSPVPEGIGSQLPTSVFPLVGATPASQALLGVPQLEVKGHHCTHQSRSKPHDGTRQRPEEAAGVGFEERRLSAGVPMEHGEGSPKQVEMAAEDKAEAQRDSQREQNLQMTSKLKASSSSVDVSAVWWRAAGMVQICIAIACDTSISLWRRLDTGHWGVLHTWHFAEVPVSQIVPLPDVHSLLCVALGGWQIAQIRFLFQSSEGGCTAQSQVKAGDIKAVLGLKNRRLVIGCGSLQNQTVEVVSFSEAGRNQKRQSLMPPKENISTFAEVDGMQDALVGLTTVNYVVVWNLKTGQLLRRIPVGQSGPASVCHKAFSDSGLLFVVLSHPHAMESEACGTAAFQIIALNPKTARSTGVAILSLPQGTAGRCVEVRVSGTSAAAVLTSGGIAVWDLFLGQCTALLPPGCEGSWSLVRWSVADDCLLARQTDGSIYVYSYTARLPLPSKTRPC